MRPRRSCSPATLVAMAMGCSSPVHAPAQAFGDASARNSGIPPLDAGNGGGGAQDGGAGSGQPDDGGPTVDAHVGSLARGPTPATPGTNFPFPQNRESSRCTYPAGYDNDDVTAAYQQWKADTVTATGANGFLRVQRPNEPGL